MSFITLDFPREVLEIASNGKQGGRYCVKNWSELERYWKGNHRVDYDTPIIRHFVMDFDCKDFKQRGAEVDFSFMHEQVKRLHRFLLRENTRHFVWFSGGGFHIWIPLKNTHTIRWLQCC